MAIDRMSFYPFLIFHGKNLLRSSIMTYDVQFDITFLWSVMEKLSLCMPGQSVFGMPDDEKKIRGKNHEF